MKDLTSGNEGKLIFNFAIPMLIGNVFQQLYNVVDSIIVGQFIGKEALAAVGSSFPIIFVLIALVIGVSSGGTIVISQFFGAKDIDKVKKTIDTLFIFLFFASFVLSAVGIIFSKDIFELIKLPPEVIPLAEEYIDIYLSGLLLFFGFYGTSAILRGLGDSKTPLYFMSISMTLNIGLDYLFVAVFNWGISGAAIATLISQGVVLIGMIIYLNLNHKIIRFSFTKMVFDKDIFIKSIRIGIPAGLQQSFVGIGKMALLRIVNNFGAAAVAAFTVAGRVDMFAAMPAMNFAAALSTFVGQNIGADKMSRVKKGLTATFLMTSLISLIVSSLVVLFRYEIMTWFSKDMEVINIGAEYLMIVSMFYILFSTMFVIGGVMRGAGDTLIPMFITLFALWIIRIPLSWFLSEEIGITGIWWGVPAAWGTGMILSIIYYMTGRWKSKTVVKHDKQAKMPVNRIVS